MCLRMARRPPGVRPCCRQLLGDRLDHAENGRDVFLVMRQHDAGGERVRYQQRVLGRQRLDHDRARWRDLFVPVRRDLDLHGLFFARLDRPDDAAVQAADDLVLFKRRHADHDGDAIAEQRDNAALAGTERQRQRRQHVAAFEARGFDAVAEQ